MSICNGFSSKRLTKISKVGFPRCHKLPDNPQQSTWILVTRINGVAQWQKREINMSLLQLAVTPISLTNNSKIWIFSWIALLVIYIGGTASYMSNRFISPFFTLAKMVNIPKFFIVYFLLSSIHSKRVYNSVNPSINLIIWDLYCTQGHFTYMLVYSSWHNHKIWGVSLFLQWRNYSLKPEVLHFNVC